MKPFAILKFIIVGITLLSLQGCPRKEEIIPPLTSEERMLLTYQNGQEVHFIKNGTAEIVFNALRNVSSFTDKITFSIDTTFPIISVSRYSGSGQYFNYLDTQGGIFFRDSIYTFELVLPYDKNLELITGLTEKGDEVKSLGEVKINGITYKNVYELKQDPKNFSPRYSDGAVEGNQEVVIWFSNEKGLLVFSCTHILFRSPTDKMQEKIEYYIKE